MAFFIGFLQLIGCLGALRLSEKLLNAYWFLLLLLLVGDAISGVFWVYKFEKIMQELQPMLRFVYFTNYRAVNIFAYLFVGEESHEFQYFLSLVS